MARRSGITLHISTTCTHVHLNGGYIGYVFRHRANHLAPHANGRWFHYTSGGWFTVEQPHKGFATAYDAAIDLANGVAAARGEKVPA